MNAGVPRSPGEAASNITPASAVFRSSAYCARSQSSRVTRCMVPRAAALRLVRARGINEAAANSVTAPFLRPRAARQRFPHSA